MSASIRNSKLCSTPYGIRGLGTQSKYSQLPARQERAQRLTASEVWALDAGRCHRLVDPVLNALRHQRFGHFLMKPIAAVTGKCSTPYGIRGLGTWRQHQQQQRWVKGAQRLTASEVWAHIRTALDSDSPLRCSTPYGIRGLGTRPASKIRRIRSRCSTPYGIRGLGTPMWGLRSAPTRCAQRLTASEVWARSKV